VQEHPTRPFLGRNRWDSLKAPFGRLGSGALVLQKVFNLRTDLAQGLIEKKCYARLSELILFTIQGLGASFQSRKQCRAGMEQQIQVGSWRIHRVK
jgi:hypothetical protein